MSGTVQYRRQTTVSKVSAGGVNGLLTNLVAYWKFDESSGTLYDSVGSNNSTACDADYYATGILGRCLYFNDANSDYVTFASSADLIFGTSDFTWVMWLYIDDLPAATQSILCSSAAGGAGLEIASTGKPRISVVGMYNSPRSDIYVHADTWTMLAVVFDSTATTNNVTFYINSSTELETFNYDFQTEAEDATTIIGKFYNDTGYFKGYFDEFGIWNGRKLSTDDLDYIYNSGSGRSFDVFD